MEALGMSGKAEEPLNVMYNRVKLRKYLREFNYYQNGLSEIKNID
jgi:hypothetical protein